MISFAFPWMLSGLAAAAIPLILHLVARREPPLQAFPAVRYLEDTARRHQRRFQLQHLLLLLVRMALVAALVLAAAGPTRAGGGPGGHAPAALVVVLDNSLSSGAIRGGIPVLHELRASAARLLARAGAGDQLWLITADGVPIRGGSESLIREVEAVETRPHRLDLGSALATAHRLLATTPLPGEIVVFSDLQATALSAAPGRGVLVGVPDGPPPDNLGIAAIETGPQPWIASGRVTIAAEGGGGLEATATVVAPGGAARQVVLPAGGQGTVLLSGLPAGWHAVTVELDPDELRLDDAAWVGLRVAPPAAVNCPSDDTHLSAACQVLRENGRIVPGTEINLDRLGNGPSIILPPSDPAALGALNRALAARGSAWRFGERVAAAARTDSSALLGAQEVQHRYRLETTGTPPSGILLTALGEPWLVRSGQIMLLGSRLDPEWTGLPLGAGFMPFMDLLLNRLARGEVTRLSAAPGTPVSLPDVVTAVVGPGGTQRVEGGAPWSPGTLGLHWLMAAADTIGVVEVNPDPRESMLGRAAPGQLAALWPEARVDTPDRVAERAFTLTARADLRAPLLWLVAVLALAELGLAGLPGRR